MKAIYRAYALAVSGTNAYVCGDADTLYHGIQQVTAAKRGADADHRGYLHRCPFFLCHQTRCRRARVSEALASRAGRGRADP
jgi:hypothetical protein